MWDPGADRPRLGLALLLVDMVNESVIDRLRMRRKRMNTLSVSTSSKQGFHDVTEKVQRAVDDSGIADGICLVFCPHTTAGVTLNENWDRSVQHDLSVGLDEISPARPEYQHGEGNSPAHLKSSLMGASQIVPVENGELVLGRWQGIYLCEFDGPRARKIHVQALEA